MKQNAFLAAMALQLFILIMSPIIGIYTLVLPLISIIVFIAGAVMKFARYPIDERKIQIGEGLFWAGAIWLIIEAILFIFFVMMISDMKGIN